MPVIAVVNRKGGSGKSTLAAHLAAWCAHQGAAVMLGDVDRQQSSRGWLRRRPAALPAIAPWAMDQKNVLRLPAGITHVVLDTPGGLQGFELARVVMAADVLLLPLGPTVFEREAAAASLAELRTLPRIASGRCALAAVGMRLDARTRADAALRNWAQAQQLQWLGHLRDAQIYPRCIEQGLSLFDLPAERVAADLGQWQPILAWLAPLLWPAAAHAAHAQPMSEQRLAVAAEHGAQQRGRPRSVVARHVAPGARPRALMPAQDAWLAGGRLAEMPLRVPGTAQPQSNPATLVRTPARQLLR